MFMLCACCHIYYKAVGCRDNLYGNVVQTGLSSMDNYAAVMCCSQDVAFMGGYYHAVAIIVSFERTLKYIRCYKYQYVHIHSFVHSYVLSVGHCRYKRCLRTQRSLSGCSQCASMLQTPRQTFQFHLSDHQNSHHSMVGVSSPGWMKQMILCYQDDSCTESLARFRCV